MIERTEQKVRQKSTHKKKEKKITTLKQVTQFTYNILHFGIRKPTICKRFQCRSKNLTPEILDFGPLQRAGPPKTSVPIHGGLSLHPVKIGDIYFLC